MLGWTPSEFWSASLYEITTAVLVHDRINRRQEPQPLDDDQLWALLDAHAARHSAANQKHGNHHVTLRAAR